MDIVNLLGSAMGLAFVSGINLYATILTVGIGINAGWIEPTGQYEQLAILGHPAVLLAAGALYAVEFFADKVPWVDTTWDSIHTFIRPFAGAFIGAAALGHLDPGVEVAALLLLGGVSLTTHATKATTRLVVNTSPEPVSNTLISLGEDVFVVGGAYAAMVHPAVMFVVVAVALAIMAYLGPKTLRLVRAELLAFGAVLGAPFRGGAEAAGAARWDRIPEAYAKALPGKLPKPDLCLRCVSGSGAAPRRNLLGYLYVSGDTAFFVWRRWFRARRQDIELAHADDAFLETKLLFARLGIDVGSRRLTFYCFRDGTGRAAAAVRVLEDRIARRAAGPPAPAAGEPAPAPGATADVSPN